MPLQIPAVITVTSDNIDVTVNNGRYFFLFCADITGVKYL